MYNLLYSLQLDELKESTLVEWLLIASIYNNKALFLQLCWHIAIKTRRDRLFTLNIYKPKD
jgi:hypothetical protein